MPEEAEARSLLHRAALWGDFESSVNDEDVVSEQNEMKDLVSQHAEEDLSRRPKIQSVLGVLFL